MIDTAMLVAMRDAIATLLPDTCYILSVARTPDGMGGWSESIGTAGTASCRMDAQVYIGVSDEQVTAGAVQPYKRYILSVPYDTTLTTENRVSHNSVVYNVVGVNVSQSWQAVKRAALEEAV